MTIHVSIGDAKARLSALVEAALRGEEVILQDGGVSKLKLVPIGTVADGERAEAAIRRRANIGIYRQKYAGRDLTVPRSMTDEDVEERFGRKFGESAD